MDEPVKPGTLVALMAKPIWIWERLRKEKPDVLARYFQAKRRLIDPSKVKQYTADDSVAVPPYEETSIRSIRSGTSIRRMRSPSLTML